VNNSGRNIRNTSTMISTTAARSMPPKMEISSCAFEAAAAACRMTPEPSMCVSPATFSDATRARIDRRDHRALRLGAIRISCGRRANYHPIGFGRRHHQNIAVEVRAARTWQRFR
jgi:hypothetical protein